MAKRRTKIKGRKKARPEDETITVTPAYGRDYTTAKAAQTDWEEGKDFIIANFFHPYDGKPCSIRDGIKVMIRYNRLQFITFPDPTGIPVRF